MTSFVGAARALAKLKDRWHGTLLFVGQPARSGSAARSGCSPTVVSRFPPRPTALRSMIMPSCPQYGGHGRRLRVRQRGLGRHQRARVAATARRRTRRGSGVLAAEIVLALQTIVSREIEPGKAAVLTIGSIHGGTKHNIIPDEVHLQLTLRSYDEQVAPV